ncbi:MAG: methyltransferase domain-containing protein [Chitinophagales bacterium]
MSEVNAKAVIDYYDECWIKRFEKGHNAESLAMHLGYFNENHLSNDSAKIRTNQFLADFLEIPQNRRVNVLDIGCGIGGTCFYLAEQYSLIEAHGINLSGTQIEFADQIRHKRNLSDRVKFSIKDYSYTELPDNNFDFVFGVESICHAFDKKKVYLESFRQLKPQGWFGFMDYIEIRSPENTMESQLLEDFKIGWAVPHYIINFKDDLESVGFTNVIEKSLTQHVMKGIENSFNKAERLLNEIDQNQFSESYLAHLKACYALKKLVELNIIDYKCIKAQKP